MKLSNFDYNLPKELIAQHPLDRRSDSRLMVLDRQTKTILHKNFKDIISYLNKDDVLILNDTKVVPARLIGRRITGGKVEIFLLERRGEYFNALMRPLKKINIGEQIILNNGLKAEIIAKDKVKFNTNNLNKIYACGKIPLPPYIKREPNELDIIRYQTMFAKKSGAVAAPTAGLHFDKDTLDSIKAKISFITLHVGIGTFQPINVDLVCDHKMPYESYNIPKNTLESIKGGQKIFACGTTVARTLEAFALTNNSKGSTNIFIYPGFKFNLIDCLITNFHLPKSTLFLLVCAFAGRDLMMHAYNEAIKNKYRFYSYGDCMLIL